MLRPAVPVDESQRIAALRSLDMMFTSAEGRFDRITRLASRLLGAPIALVSLIGDECQWFKSAQGLAATETERDVSFCAHAILADATFVIEDAALDPRFCDNPLVVGPPSIRFYAGHPVRSADGSRIGTLCVIDRQPRRLSGEQLGVLRDLAHLVEGQLQRSTLSAVQRALVGPRDDSQRRAMTDPLTRVWSRAAIMEILHAELDAGAQADNPGVVLVRVDNAAGVRRRDGATAAEALLAEIADRVRRAVAPGDAVGRFDTDELLLVLRDGDPRAARAVVEGIRDAVRQEPVELPAGLAQVALSIGIAARGSRDDTPECLIAAARGALAA